MRKLIALSLALILCLGLLPLSGALAAGETITASADGRTVMFDGSGFTAGTQYQITIYADDKVVIPARFFTADANGVLTGTINGVSLGTNNTLSVYDATYGLGLPFVVSCDIITGTIPTPEITSVSAQNGALTEGVAGTAFYTVETANIPAGSYTPTFTPALPEGVSVTGTFSIAGDSGILTLATTAAAAAGTTDHTIAFGGADPVSFTLKIDEAAIVTKTIAVGQVQGTLTAGVPGSVTFAITSENIEAGSHLVILNNAPAGISAASTIDIAADGTGTLTLSGSAATVEGTYSNLTITVDNVTSAAFSLLIGEGSEPGEASINVSPSPFNFLTSKIGYDPASLAQQFIITNTGTGVATGLTATIENDLYFEISTPLSSTTINANSASPATLSVRPKAGLPINIYSGKLIITADNNIRREINLTFTVNETGFIADPGDGGTTTVPIVPRSPSARAGDGSVTLSWSGPTWNAGDVILYQISIDDGEWIGVGSVNTFTFTGLNNGQTYSFRIRALNAMGYSSTVTITATPNGTEEDGETDPNDVPAEWAASDVAAAIELGIIPASLQNGYTNNVTRAEFASIAVALCEALKGEEIEPQRNAFTDTEDVNVEKLAALGVVAGGGGGKFNPNDILSRQQTLTLFYNMVVEMGYPFEVTAPSFEDASAIAGWAYDAIGALQGANIIGGDGANFNPKGNMTRQAAIVAALRFWNALND